MVGDVVVVAYNFKSRWADDVAEGRKRGTIRADGKRRHARPGEALQLYTGMRTRACRKLVEPDPICRDSIPVRLDRGLSERRIVVTYAGQEMEREALEALARGDGFATAAEMLDWFVATHGLPFSGRHITW